MPFGRSRRVTYTHGFRRRHMRLGAGIGAFTLACAFGVSASGPGTSLVGAVIRPAVSDYVQLSTSETPPTQAQCASVGRRCFGPQATQAAYDVGPLYAAGFNGAGETIAVVDSYGSDTMAHDLHVYDQAFGLQPMCGEEGGTGAAAMPTFSHLGMKES